MEHELSIAYGLATKAGEEITRFYLQGALSWTKPNNTPVTEADMASNRILLEGISKHFPNDAIVSEETGTQGKLGSRVWYIDPLDSTSSFVNHGDTFAIHIGLAVNSFPHLGIVYKPMTKECYAGIVGQGAWKSNPFLNRQPLAVNQTRKSPIIITSSRFEDSDLARTVADAYSQKEMLYSGSVGIKVARIADGIADLCIGGKRESTWDVCAPLAILNAAGGSYGYLNGGTMVFRGQDKMNDRIIYASSNDHFDNASGILHQKMVEGLANYQIGSPR